MRQFRRGDRTNERYADMQPPVKPGAGAAVAAATWPAG